MSDVQNNEWLQEYAEFVKFDGAEIPAELNGRVISRVLKLINPNPLGVFFKILGVHLAVGLLSMSVCHQFGMNPFNTEVSLADWMMQVGGYQFCMIGCGVTFVSLSVLAAGYFLTLEEVNALKRTEFLQTLVLGMISLGLFAAFGAHLAIGVAGLWLLGAIVGGFAATQTVWRLKRAQIA